MMLLTNYVVLATAFFGSAFGQSSSTTLSTSASSTSTSAITTHTVAVGAVGHNFDPSSVEADIGDIVEYRFYPQNHSVGRAAFKQPCIPYEVTGTGRIGFWSGFFPTQLVLSDPPKFQIRVNDTEPVFFYCSAPGACFDGMVGVINPNATQTFDIQHTFAANATQEFSPGEVYFEPENGSTRTQTTSGATPAPTAGNEASATTSGTPAVTSSSHSGGLSKGAIAGIAIGGVFGLILAAAVIYMCGKQKSMSDILHRQSAVPNPTVYHPASPGFAEANYPNINKGPMSMISSSNGRYSEPPYGGGVASTEDGRSLRSSSPPIDERTGMIMNPSGFPQQGHTSPRSAGQPFPSPMYSVYEHDADGQLKTPPPQDVGPHELPGQVPPARSPEELYSPHAFSFNGSESGYTDRRR
ncbi:hypothetical protein BJ878DRAFT_55859 [Calycina marina]|uniref:Extracellular serine-rich protein n=1 Tax=Calycina marina TaxID=1763456 RepID=A0A9P7Z3K0_9HELO|nr:hypothetical protein BJ878DRAFT_55859 [Calycina marina]